MAFGWRADDGRTLNAGLVAFLIFQGIAKKPYTFVIFQGGGSGPPVPSPSGSAHVFMSFHFENLILLQIRSCLSSPRSAKKKGGVFRFGRKQKEVPVPPVMPPAGKSPSTHSLLMFSIQAPRL